MAVCNVISHRGSNKIAPQNTLPAFRKSIDFHADGFETDVHLTFDGVPVICHNYTIDETSNGKGLIANQTLDYLKLLISARISTGPTREQKFPHLRNFFAFAKKLSSRCSILKLSRLRTRIIRLCRKQ